MESLYPSMQFVLSGHMSLFRACRLFCFRDLCERHCPLDLGQARLPRRYE